VGIGLGGSLGADELLPCLVAFVDDLDGVLLGLGLSGEGKDVLWIRIGSMTEELHIELTLDCLLLRSLTSGFPSGIL